MTVEATPQPNIIKLTEQQAASIVEQSNNPELSAEQIREAHGIGNLVLSDTVAVVIKMDDDGNETASHLIHMGDDIGTHVRTDGDFAAAAQNRFRYGTPEEALARIQDTKEAQADEGMDSTLENVPVQEADNAIENEPTAEIVSTTDGASDKEEVLNTNQEAALQELKDSWQLDQEASMQDAVRKLDGSLYQLNNIGSMVGSEDGLIGSLSDLSRRIKDTLDTNVVHVNYDKFRSALDQIFNTHDRLYDILQDRANLLPIRSRQEIEQSSKELIQLGQLTQELMRQPGVIDQNVAYDVWRMLNGNGGPQDALQKNVLLARTQVEEKLAECTSYTEASAKIEAQKQQELFADERIANMAKTLRAEGLTEADIESATIAMERYVDDAIADKGSGLQFADLMYMSANEKLRSGGKKIGERGSSRRVAAEMAIDMLSGKFSVEDSNKLDDIILNKDGKPETGSHRTAALMTLYGKNWVKAAEQQGFKLVRKP